MIGIASEVRRRGLLSPRAMVWGLILLTAAVVTLIPSEWSFVDDPGQKSFLLENISQHGFLSGIISTVQGTASADQHWGLFRPVWYLYAAIFYLTNPPLAHALRTAMFIYAIASPALVASRRADASHDYKFLFWAASLLLVNAQLYQGLSFLSLQELTGVTFVASGLSVQSTWRRGLLFVAAAWVKTPFVWLLLAWAIYLVLTRRTRRQGILWIILSLLTISVAALAARRGTYTSDYELSAHHMIGTFKASMTLFAWPGLIVVLGLVALRIDPRTLNWRSPLFLVFLLGGLGYFATLLPWTTTAYYAGPVIYLLSVASIFLCAHSPRPTGTSGAPLAALALVISALAGGRMAFVMGSIQIDRNATVVQLAKFAEELPPCGEVIGINGPEAAVRLGEILRLRNRGFANQTTYVADNARTPVDYYIQLTDQGGGNSTEMGSLIKTLPRASIWRPLTRSPLGKGLSRKRCLRS